MHHFERCQTSKISSCNTATASLGHATMSQSPPEPLTALSINYLPKHRKYLSLSALRNINMKNLLLNLGDSAIDPPPRIPSASYALLTPPLPPSFRPPPVLRQKNLSLATNTSSPTPSSSTLSSLYLHEKSGAPVAQSIYAYAANDPTLLQTPSITQTPLIPPAFPRPTGQGSSPTVLNSLGTSPALFSSPSSSNTYHEPGIAEDNRHVIDQPSKRALQQPIPPLFSDFSTPARPVMLGSLQSPFGNSKGKPSIHTSDLGKKSTRQTLEINQSLRFEPFDSKTRSDVAHLANDDFNAEFSRFLVTDGGRTHRSTLSASQRPDRSKWPTEELQELLQLDAYPDGPANVLNGLIFLYLDPLHPESSTSLVDVDDYALVINVARECRDISSQFVNDPNREYLYIPWTHTSSISDELPRLVRKIAEYDDSEKSITPAKKRKILVHCQCGVSRSACVVVAYYMYKFLVGVNEAYELLKSGTDNPNELLNKQLKEEGYHIDACDRICPNMSLIFELMEFGESLGAKNGLKG